MATLREYFDSDFTSAVRVYVKLQSLDHDNVDFVILYDFTACSGFCACYVKGEDHSLNYFLDMIALMQLGKSQVSIDGRVFLPSARSFPGKMEIRNENILDIRAQFHGDPEWIAMNDLSFSNRIFIYSEYQLSDGDILQIKARGRELGQQLQFRSKNHADIRSKFETPLAFISHDSRDKTEIAQKIATKLQRMMCPVWYDEYSLKVGDNLRDSIEKGLKTSEKCVLILSNNFLSNTGWTKREFDSIFMREMLEKKQMILPIWCGVTDKDIYEYSPSLLNIKGINWQLGEEEVCRQLAQAILGQTNRQS